MNRIYKLKFDKRRNELVVVSEITAGVGKAKATGSVEGGKASRRGVRVMALSLLSGMVMMAHPVSAASLPTGGQIVAGSGSIQTPSGNLMNVHQNSQNMVANWNSFDIGKGSTVQFYQPNSSAVALNRVVGGGESQIMGNLRANGQVFLVNPNGVLFGQGASVSTSGFVASTRDIKNDDFMNRRYTFSGGQKAGAAIVNQGALTTNPGGYIVLAADKVSNSGTIRTPGGKAVLAATERVTLQLDNGGLTSVQVTGDVVNALVENRGLVSARDGQVYLTAHGRDMLMNTVLNVSGVVEASGMHRQDGNIVLDGGNSGVVHLNGTLMADNASGRGGKVVVQGQNLLLDKGSNIVATGGQGGGEVYVGGGWQGKDASIRNADKVVMQDGARINVSATLQGNGGTAVLWSESFTSFRGQISAKGGENGGNGGQVETSSHGNLQAFGSVSASAKRGQAGNWLLDPLDITVVSGSSTNVNESTDASGAFEISPGAAGSQVSNTSINNELNNGTSVTIMTNSSVAGSNQSGNITVNADINKTSGADASLTLKADGNITIQNHNITSTAGKLNISLLGAGSNTARVHLNGSTLQSNGGDITIGRMAGGEANALTVKVFNSTLNASSSSTRGNITVSAWNPNINLSEAQWVNTVRNGGSLLEINSSNLTGNQITLTGNQNGEFSRHLPVYVNNSTLSATGDITLTGNASNSTNASVLELRGTNTLTSESGNITVSSNSGVLLNGTNPLTATNGSINVIGNRTSGDGIQFTGNNTLTAAKDINITGNSSGNTGVRLKGKFTLTATGGNIRITGNTTSNNQMGLDWEPNNSGVLIYAGTGNLTASNGNISITGTANQGTGTLLRGDHNLNASYITINGSTSYSGDHTANSGIYLKGNLTFTGNTTFNGKANTSSGVMFSYGTNSLTFNNGTVVFNASNTGRDNHNHNHDSAIGFDLYDWNYNNKLDIILNNSNLTMNAHSNKSPGMAWGNADPNYTGLVNVSGTGNFTINASSNVSMGFAYASVSASGLNGTATLNGSSVNGGPGVLIHNSHMTNMTITGNATGNGSGVNISGNSTLNNTTVNGNGT
ncbi:TPA: filamentous hemagglutinin N-terminal domain-containing protein, partial [Salmonella enterica]|nr:filamentous hemagglutinin N-terminal domain-containing protein [Salmonella enterica]HAK8195694.1 filamentous hemagglutinin N-terminal domain-containing protein [Salmonella enterica]HAK8435139.1 filamentous hemagglutinin N-terminal domain-containing protein [Salmonella enterica]